MSDDKGPKKFKPASLPPKAAKPMMPPGASKSKPSLPPGSGSKPAGPPSAKLPPGGVGARKNGLSKKDFETDQDVRWCPGCGDYAILAAVQRLMPELGIPREDVVFISGIGCSSRFPYYMNTYGMHSIHGRAPAIATGLKVSRPELDVWIVTGDGDALSIGGNHLVHLLRRNVNVQLLLFNNQIYGLTKGQYSPTSEIGKVTKSTPFGSLDHPFNPASLALGADATFVARSMDRDPKHLQGILKAAHTHTGASFVEVYQNCNIFNDGAFFDFTEKGTKPRRALFVEHGKPLTFDGGKQGLRLDDYRFKVISLEGKYSIDDCLVYDETNRGLAGALTRIFFDDDLPQPFGIFFRQDRPNYDAQLHDQLKSVLEKKGPGSLKDLLNGGDTWMIN